MNFAGVVLANGTGNVTNTQQLQAYTAEQVQQGLAAPDTLTRVDSHTNSDGRPSTRLYLAPSNAFLIDPGSSLSEITDLEVTGHFAAGNVRNVKGKYSPSSIVIADS